jgi:hypothetical protein
VIVPAAYLVSVDPVFSVREGAVMHHEIKNPGLLSGRARSAGGTGHERRVWIAKVGRIARVTPDGRPRTGDAESFNGLYERELSTAEDPGADSTTSSSRP